MLKYEVKLGKDNFKKDELVWKEKYLSPDLSVITGVTNANYHLEKFNKLTATNSIINSDGTLFLDSKNVQTQGFIIVSGKTYETYSGRTVDYSVEKSGTTIDYRYLINNGKYFYWGEISANTSGYSVNNLLTVSGDPRGEYEILETINVPCGKNDNPIKIDTLYWIEDGTVTIDGDTYIYDRDEGENGILKYGINGMPLSYSAITECDGIGYYPYDVKDYQDVTKFKLTKQEEISKEFEKITFSKYFFYVKYKEHYCQVKKSGDTDNYSFICEIPKYVLSGGTMQENLKPIVFDVYFTVDNSDLDSLRAAHTDENKINSTNYDKHNVKNLDELLNVVAFVYVEDDDTYFLVEHNILNANGGNQIAVYLEDEYTPLKQGEKIIFSSDASDEYTSMIYCSCDYGSEEDEMYAFYNGCKYKVKPNICDKVIINESEYPIDYINGKIESADCLVTIGNEEITMKIIDAASDGGKLKRYGKIVTASSKDAVDAIYDIKSYSGITVDEKNYTIYNSKDINGNIIHYVTLDLPTRYRFSIQEIIGSSMYVCKPDINVTDFTDDFSRYISEVICDEVVTNQTQYELFIKNKIFGEDEITDILPFRITNKPLSSDDYYNLFNDLKIYVDNAYIHIPISFKIDMANDALKDNIISRDFFDAEREKAINPIVDMEKDVYVPKYIVSNGGQYSGSNTRFESVSQINFNFHFRTRNLNSWKVNDGYNNIEYAADASNRSNDNWFITDFYPYREILGVSGDTLQQTSDLMGLLHFTDEDIFYQKSNVSKSFARLSFYDSTDPQTQSLLATSCIFIDEHKLFKRFIDNSRKYRYDYGVVAEPTYHRNASGFVSPSATYSGITSEYNSSGKTDVTRLHKYNKISVNTEFLGVYNTANTYSEISDSNKIIIDEDHRISSQLVVENKYSTDTSSEGFYLYMFREYAEKLHPKPIYMKIEFNHAGIGKQIPFLIPMHWSGNTTSGATNYNKMYPDCALSLSNTSHLAELRQGIPLSYVYAQTYIPLYAVYDFEHKEYGYVFDSRYVTQDCNGVINLNLFEMKIQNESEETLADDDQRLIDIKTNRQIKAIVNINEEQFNKRYFNDERE
jgi:hypothetical protein